LLAANVLVVTQVVAASLLFPLLLKSGPAAVAVISAAWPFLVLAGVLSGAPPERIAAAGCYVSAWLVALWTWGEVGNGSALRAVAVASCSPWERPSCSTCNWNSLPARRPIAVNSPAAGRRRARRWRRCGSSPMSRGIGVGCSGVIASAGLAQRLWRVAGVRLSTFSEQVAQLSPFNSLVANVCRSATNHTKNESPSLR
jgi:hypothetical protein